MRSWMIAFSTGIIAAGLLPVLPPPTLLLALAGVVLWLQMFAHGRSVGALLLGVWWVCHSSSVLLDLQWPRESRQAEAWVTGIVTGLPQLTANGQRFTLRVLSRCAQEGAAACQVWTRQPPGVLVQLNSYTPMALLPGQQWQLLVRLRPLHGFSNPGTFDYALWQLQQGITATGYVREHDANQLLEVARGQRLNRLRGHLLAQLESVAGLQHAGLLAALTLGIRQGVEERDWQLFTNTGTNHLMVISGLHIGLIAGLMFLLGSRSATVISPLVARLPASHFGALTALGGALAYGAMAGFSLPIQRALIMTGVVLCGVLMRRQTAAWNSYWLAMGLVLWNEPLAPQSAGFWLSFGAVAVLLARQRATEPETAIAPATKLLVACRMQGRLWLGMLPVMLVWFQQVSWLAPLINLLAIPLIGFLVVPLALAGLALLNLIPVAGEFCLRAADLALHCYLSGLQEIMTFAPGALVTLPALLPVGQACLLAATILCLGQYRFRTLASALLLVCGALLFERGRLPDGSVRVMVIDVGQGLAVLVSTAGHHLLYDTGPRYSDSFDAGSDLVVPVLRSMNVRQLDRVIVSHADSDHAGGAQGVLAAFPDAMYSLPDELNLSAFNHQPCIAGTQWQWDGVAFRILHPDDGSFTRNNSSCVLEVVTGNHRVLMPGDIEREVEYSLLRKDLLQPVSLLLAPHHGSRTSSSSALVKVVAPADVVIANGYLNRFGHPAAAVEQRYRLAGSRIWRTDQSGAVTFWFSPEQGEPRVEAYRLDKRRFWY
jgi:competence protein ComEC